MATSTIPAAIDAIISMLGASAGLSGVTIYDGQPTIDDDPDYVAIGFADDISPSVIGTQQPAGIGNLRRSEVYEIGCEVSSWLGDNVMKTVRDRAFTLLAAIETAIRGNGSLTGTVIFADFGRNFSVIQAQTSMGAVVVIRFTINIDLTRI